MHCLSLQWAYELKVISIEWCILRSTDWRFCGKPIHFCDHKHRMHKSWIDKQKSKSTPECREMRTLSFWRASPGNTRLSPTPHWFGDNQLYRALKHQLWALRSCLVSSLLHEHLSGSSSPWGERPAKHSWVAAHRFTKCFLLPFCKWISTSKFYKEAQLEKKTKKILKRNPVNYTDFLCMFV